MTKYTRERGIALKRIADVTHPQIQEIIRLQRRDVREKSGVFFADGIRFVFQAAEQKSEIIRLVVAPKLLNGSAGLRIAERLIHNGIPFIEVEAHVYYHLSLAQEAQGLGAVVRQQWQPLEAIGSERAAGNLWVACESIRSAGNLGTIIRTCDAVEAAGVILLGDAVDPYDPATVRASMGAIFTQRFVRSSLKLLTDWKQRYGVQLVGTSPTGTHDYRDVDYRSPTILLTGSERKGLDRGDKVVCDYMVRIPMAGRCDSLNLAVATGIVLYEVAGQRRLPHVG